MDCGLLQTDAGTYVDNVYTNVYTQIMITKATKWGNSLAVRIPKQFSDYLHIKDGAGLEFEKYGRYLLLKPVKIIKAKSATSLKVAVKYKDASNFFEEIEGNGGYWKNNYEGLVENIKFLSSNKSLDFLKKEPDLYENY